MVKTVAFIKFTIVEFFAFPILLNTALEIKTKAWNINNQDSTLKNNIPNSRASQTRENASTITFRNRNNTPETQTIYMVEKRILSSTV
jgi:hypothetical protein